MSQSNLAAFLPSWPPQPEAFLWVALAVVATGLVGELAFRSLRLPRISGYFVVGLVFGAFGLDLDAAQLTGNLRTVFDLALAVLLFELGTRVDLRWLRANPWLPATSLAESAAAFVVVLTLLQLTGSEFGTALSVAVILLSTSPAIVMRVVSEFRADGQVTERLMMLTALSTVYAVIGAKLLFGWLHHSGGSGSTADGAIDPLAPGRGSKHWHDQPPPAGDGGHHANCLGETRRGRRRRFDLMILGRGGGGDESEVRSSHEAHYPRGL